MPPSVRSSTTPVGATGYLNDSNDAAAATVQVGEDNLSQVAQRLGVDLESLRRANPQVSDSGKTQAGQEIHLPPPRGQQTPRDTQREVESIPQSSLPPAPLSDPLTSSMVQAKLATGPGPSATLDAFEKAGGNFVYADADGGGSGSAKPAVQKSAPKELPEIKDMLTHPAKNSVGKDVFPAVQKDIEVGNYTKAFQTLDTLIKTKGENLWDEEKGPVTAMRDQLEFLSQMQKAGIKADYPPTEAQLVEYFKTLKDQPAAARQAFEDYANRFQVHPVNIATADFVMRYSREKHPVEKGSTTIDVTTDVPRSWSDVAGHPVSSEHFPQYIGKQMNDCKGYAFMAEELLGAAGFKVVHHVDAAPSKFGDGHMMVVFTHPGEKGLTLTSNDRAFRGGNERELAKQGFSYAAGGKDNVTGREHYFTGKTAADAEIQQGIFEARIKGVKYDELPR
jgi:LysM repeat protein